MAPGQDRGAAGSEPEARERERRERRAILDQMTAEAEELGLYAVAVVAFLRLERAAPVLDLG